MKIKLVLKIAAFFFTLTLAVNITATFTLKKNNPEAREKIYNFITSRATS